MSKELCPCGHSDAQHVERTVHGNKPREEFVERKCTKCECVDTRVKRLEKPEGIE